MISQLYVVEQPDGSFSIFDKNSPAIPVHTAPNLHSAVDYCYHSGNNFEVEIMEQIEAGWEIKQEME
jgi:hypothetical protein